MHLPLPFFFLFHPSVFAFAPQTRSLTLTRPQFCPGGDLYAAIKKGGMSPSEVECCFKQILCGVG
jgi:hypothetical protein